MSETVGSDPLSSADNGDNSEIRNASPPANDIVANVQLQQIVAPAAASEAPTSLAIAPIVSSNIHAAARAIASSTISTGQLRTSTAHSPMPSSVGKSNERQTESAPCVQPKPTQQRLQYHHNSLVQRQHSNCTGGSAASAHRPSSASSYEEHRLSSITGPGSQYVKLNVGGSLHYTTIATLTKQPDSMLRAMFSGRLEVLTDSEGWILIDRCGKHFPLILNYLRDSSVALPESRREVIEILAEAKYYCLQGLVELCNAWLEMSQKAEEEPTVCKVPIITTSKEEKALLQSTTKPVVKLLLNRHNNKYSYTPQSDDNLLKNLELFDKLVLRFYERVMFIKDVGAANEVCSWSFYGHRKKIGEVCCTSIVYATDKKHTKVEFPEARIYEEAMNILLFEPPVVCSLCQSVACQAATCSNSDSPDGSSSPCCAAECERIQLEKLHKARAAVRATSLGGRADFAGTGGSV